MNIKARKEEKVNKQQNFISPTTPNTQQQFYQPVNSYQIKAKPQQQQPQLNNKSNQNIMSSPLSNNLHQPQQPQQQQVRININYVLFALYNQRKK